MKSLSHPRWEDYEYDYENGNPNSWIGDGWTENEKNKAVNVDYLDDDQVDFPTGVLRQVERGRGDFPKSVSEHLEYVTGVNGVALGNRNVTVS